MILWLLALLAGCGDDPCVLMCEEAARQTAICVDGGEGSWDSLGYADRDDLQDACETWAWEEELLRRDVGASVEELESTCEDWRGAELGEGCAPAWLSGAVR